MSIASKSKAPSDEQARERLRQHLQNAQGHQELTADDIDEAVFKAEVQVALWFRGSPISLLKCVSAILILKSTLVALIATVSS